MTGGVRTRHRAGVAAGLLAGLAALTACAADDDASDDASTSRTSAPTATSAPGFAPPDACDVDDLVGWTAAVRIDQRAGTADAVVRVATRDASACEIVLAPGAQVASFVEPNVVVEEGGWAELVVGQSEDRCARPMPITSIDIGLDDGEVVVPTAAVGGCDVLLTELFAVDRPDDACSARDVTAVWRPGGFVVRNDGMRGCVLGSLDAVELPGGAPMVPTSQWDAPDHPVPERVGPAVDALAPGDVAYFPTYANPLADCDVPLVDARLVLSTATVDVQAPSSCVFVDLGAARPWYGSPDAPLVGADPAAAPAAWLRELDAFGDPCHTVAVAPVDLVDGAPILSPATIDEDELGRVATWGDPSTNGVTQRLDVVIDVIAPDDATVVDVVDGDDRRAVVVAPGTGDAPVIDVAEDDGSCVRRYVLPPGTSPEAATDAARRWVGRDPS